jgi:hypothetical protein
MIVGIDISFIGRRLTSLFATPRRDDGIGRNETTCSLLQNEDSARVPTPRVFA